MDKIDCVSFYICTHLSKEIGVCVSILYIKIVIYTTHIFVFYKELYIYISQLYMCIFPFP